MKTIFIFSLLALTTLAVTTLTATAQAQVIKNEQTLLGGTLTRAGNTMQSQLTDSELTSLCEQGYTSAFFMYAGAQKRTVQCSKGSISYESQGLKDVTPILQDIYQDIQSGGRTFVHCNNGAHASGMVAAFALRQFCGYTGDQAFSYWSAHIGGYALPATNMAIIHRRMLTFQSVPGLELTAEEQARVCK